MNSHQALEALLPLLSEEDAAVFANGKIGREANCVRPRKRNFYLLGSMGLAASLGLPLALENPEKRVFVFDGDGNVLMGLPGLALVGAAGPANFYHLVIDNEAYATTGNQPSLSARVDLGQIATACGYARAYLFRQPENLKESFAEALKQTGPLFIQIKVNRDIHHDCPRLPATAMEINESFRRSMGMK